MWIEIINGPNLQRLGQREPDIYGHTSMEDYLTELRQRFDEVHITYFQSNHEGALIDRLYELDEAGADGIVLNAGAYTHTSLALGDALRAIAPPTVEVHISNVYQREEVRHRSFIAPYCCGSITGLGLLGYELALRALISQSPR